jgi:hypothetical protein
MTSLFVVSLILSVILYSSAYFALNFSFICEKHGQKLHVQATYLPASPDEFDMNCDGIKHRNIREFLLMLEWN